MLQWDQLERAYGVGAARRALRHAETSGWFRGRKGARMRTQRALGELVEACAGATLWQPKRRARAERAFAALKAALPYWAQPDAPMFGD